MSIPQLAGLTHAQFLVAARSRVCIYRVNRKFREFGHAIFEISEFPERQTDTLMTTLCTASCSEIIITSG